ncbi:MAG: hypothetical protein H7330_16260 [Hymenobacteraceae bacterium]|nr:hypothetical protein [Hymenobacteraceae bacterium]
MALITRCLRWLLVFLPAICHSQPVTGQDLIPAPILHYHQPGWSIGASPLLWLNKSDQVIVGTTPARLRKETDYAPGGDLLLTYTNLSKWRFQTGYGGGATLSASISDPSGIGLGSVVRFFADRYFLRISRLYFIRQSRWNASPLAGLTYTHVLRGVPQPAVSKSVTYIHVIREPYFSVRPSIPYRTPM